jgi:hypothetical protein
LRLPGGQIFDAGAFDDEALFVEARGEDLAAKLVGEVIGEFVER